MWTLGDDRSINFYYDTRMEGSSLADKINPNMIHSIEKNTKLVILLPPQNIWTLILIISFQTMSLTR